MIINVTQGSSEWKELRKKYFTASEAPAMLGLSKYTTRNELLRQKATGETKEITEAQQRLFDEGHRVEALVRPLAEEVIEEELFPATLTEEVEGLPLLASMDGLTMFSTIGWECKLWNEEFAAMVRNNIVPDTHWPQLEHQILVSGVDKIFFVVSDGTKDKFVGVWYESLPERRAQVIAGWKQFMLDLANYQPEAVAEKVEAAPVRELPAIRYTMNGLSLESNLDAYKQAATDLVELSNRPLETDQDFADAEARQKVFTKAEKDIKDACERVMGEIDSINAFVKDMRFIAENIRQARLAEAKQINQRKEEIKADILRKASQAIEKAEREAEDKIHAPLPRTNIDVMAAMKGKKTVESLMSAADDAVAQAKIAITQLVNVALANIALMKEHKDYRFLFNDWSQIAFKANDDFKALVSARIATYEAEQKAKEEAQRERIRAEEQAKLQREAEAKVKAASMVAQAKEEAQKPVEPTYMEPPKAPVKPFKPTRKTLNTELAAWAETWKVSEQAMFDLLNTLYEYGINGEEEAA